MSTTLKGEVRAKVGSRDARKLRARGLVPASIQGEGKAILNLTVNRHELLAARRHHEHLFDIEFPDHEPETTLIRELQWDPLGEEILHIEFRRVIRGKKTEVEVEIEFVGHPKGGVLNHLITHLTVEALPSEIPDSIPVRVDHLEPGHPLHVSDLVFPEGVTLVEPAPEVQIAVVVVPRGEEEAAPAEAAEEEAAEEKTAEEAPKPEE